MKRSSIFLFLALCVCLLWNGLIRAQSVDIEGELRRWHNITLTFDGPNSSETASPNPFTDYRMEVIFTHSTTRTTYRIPGYFAACGNAANNSCTAGNKWRVHFAPDRPGQWDWQAILKTGNDIAIKTGGQSAGFFDGRSGSITVQESDKSGKDHRATNRGRLQYVNTHYLRYAGSTPDQPNGPWFLKAGADAPENTLNYEDFDATPATKFTPKTWQPHQQDYRASDARAYTWANGKGTELLGVVRYLSDIKQVNALSFLTFSLDGDDKSVFPHLIKPNEAGRNWGQVYHDRFDVSKMAQWEQIFAYADKKGVFLHFKTQETENDQKMDGGAVGRERKLYYRELIARFGHHLALNWNLGEENTQTTAQRRDMAQYFADHDPYHHHVVIHSYPNQKDKIYDPMLGNKSELTGASLQSGINSIHDDVVEWREKSANAGRPWVIANDEQGNASIGVDVDPKDNQKVRKEVIWGTLLGGGCGFEYYYGYQTGSSDLTSQNHRTRDAKYNDAARALAFFNQYVQSYLPDVVSRDDESSQAEDYVLRTSDKQAYVVYLPDGGTTELLQLPNQGYDYRWYNPRNGQMGASQALTGNQLRAPNNQDWVALIESNGSTPTPAPTPTPPTSWTFEEVNGVVAFEAEHFNQQTLNDDRTWYETSTSQTPNVRPDPDPNHASSASGDAYIEILPDTRVTHSDPLVNGVSFSNTPGRVAILNYEVYFNNPGTYFVWVRAYSTGTEDNGVHVGLDGKWPASGQRMQWCNGKNKWTWESKQRTNANHCGEAKKIFLNIPSKGLHTISFSMREDGFEMDKMVLSKAYSKPSGDGPAEVLYGGTGGNPSPTPPAPTPNTCANPLPAQSVSNTTAGLLASIYKLNSLKKLPDFSNLTADQQVVVPSIEIPAAAGNTGFAAVYEGWIEIPDEGEYTFYLKSDDGAKLMIDGQTVVDNDGLHACRERSGTACLATGKHAVRVEFFQAQGGQCLELAMMGSTLSKQSIPASFYSHIAPQVPPTPPTATCAQSTYGNNGQPWLPNQAIQAENFDMCTNGFDPAGTTYWENDAQWQGNRKVRPQTKVDIGLFSGTGRYIGWIKTGEFWEYTLETSATSYTLTVNLATPHKTEKSLAVIVDGIPVDTLTCTDTKSWTRFEPFTTRPFALTAGKHIVRLQALSDHFNIDWLRIEPEQTNPNPPSQTFQKTFSVIDDAYLQGSTRHNNTLIRVEKNRRTAYLKFDLRGFTGTITGARLHLQVYSDPGNGTIEVRKGDKHNWTEQTLHTGNAPQAGDVMGSLNGTFRLGKTYTFELDPSLVQSGEYLSLVLNHLTGNDVAFASDESGMFVPKLEIDYTTNARLADNLLDVTVYPNPFDQIFTINVGEQHGLNEILLVDMTGRVIEQWYLAPDQSILKVQLGQDIPSGLYTLQLRGNTHRQFVWVIKE